MAVVLGFMAVRPRTITRRASRRIYWQCSTLSGHCILCLTPISTPNLGRAEAIGVLAWPPTGCDAPHKGGGPGCFVSSLCPWARASVCWILGVAFWPRFVWVLWFVVFCFVFPLSRGFWVNDDFRRPQISIQLGPHQTNSCLNTTSLVHGFPVTI